MLNITNDAKKFFEKTPGDILIYKADNCGYWISWYMKKLKIPFVCFVDSTAGKEGETFNGYPIYHENIIDKYVGGAMSR